ncbi:MAG: hypothetical protein CBC53_004260 [Alphaproteobacteria bacterium TMED93]|nr:MAG: hypothetical protein CBC53_004260 [Alphaproteobacteria bacterium TMED93]|tara:strand:+ start:534 stop:914 length:381 start_codon:yes stop_codon:yes gene_type:complete
MRPISSKNLLLPSLSLFTSLGTLFCCALPALFVVLGAGAALAGLLSNAPFLIVLSKYKILLFLISGSLMTLSGYLIWRSRNAPCPADPLKARACKRLRIASLVIYFFSVTIYAIGFFFAFIITKIM